MHCAYQWDNGDLTWYRHLCILSKGHDGEHECACGVITWAVTDDDNSTPDEGDNATDGPASRVPDNIYIVESPK